jgi:hypothetical protein
MSMQPEQTYRQLPQVVAIRTNRKSPGATQCVGRLPL